MTSINVNLNWNPHDPETEGRILLPCPIPRSVTFSVALGECDCGEVAARAPDRTDKRHVGPCPARPVRVSCSISGKTWEESKVEEIEYPIENYTGPSAFAACRDRWALVKALVLGVGVGVQDGVPVPRALVERRDAVFASLADMARAEEALEAAAVRCAKALGADGDLTGTSRASHEFLAAYVETLVEQVSVL